jgi:hypothetical protein
MWVDVGSHTSLCQCASVAQRGVQLVRCQVTVTILIQLRERFLQGQGSHKTDTTQTQ